MQLLQIWPMLGVSQNFYRQQRPAYLAKESTCNLAKALGKLGYIVAETFVILDVSSDVSMFAHPWKHCCGNKICFPGSKNVSYQIQKHLMFPYVSH
jgi:hypothetical protein